MYKLCVYIPEDHLEVVKNALFNQGAGRIANYDHCCWQTRGEGQFRPLKGSHPERGSLNNLEKVVEYKVELVCEDLIIHNVIQALKESHPYEEPAYQVWKIETFDEVLTHSSTLRCFFAISFDAKTRDEIHKLARKVQEVSNRSKTKWVQPENYHLTLRFLGETRTEIIDELINDVKIKLNDFKPFYLTLDYLELFPKHHPHVLSLHAEPEASLDLIANFLEESAVKFGFKKESRDFKSHMTLARIKSPHPVKLPPSEKVIKTKVNEIVLMKSELSENGSKYSVVGKIELK